MCMIIIKPKNKTIDIEHLIQANKHNRDGFGVSYHNGKEVVVKKTLEFVEFLEIVEFIGDRDAVFHMRNTSAGSCDIDNAQPIMMSNGESFCHNGTIFNLSNHKYKSDSVLLSEIIEGLPKGEHRSRAISAILDRDRGVVMHNDGSIERFGSWIELNGCYYSSDYYKKKDTVVTNWEDWYDDAVYDYRDDFIETSLVAVYGTLKQGYGNHRIIEDAMFVGHAITRLEYPMIDNGYFPYLYQEEGGERVVVEVYEVTKDMLKKMDELEGVEYGHYYRTQVDVVFDDGFEDTVNIYFSCDRYDGETETIREWGV